MNPFNIKKADLDHAPVIAEFNRRMALETEDYDLPYDRILAGVKNLFANPQYGFYIVAVHDNQIAGCLLITYEWSDWRNGVVWWIQSVFLPPEFRRRGLFRAMYEYIRREARQNGAVGLRLYVDHENRIAQKTYENLGMKQARYRMYEDML
ncbi:GNAT family N-acetyltransferase [candidate division KSB1 bacterium]|nr:GNAT family N-acetyltransferase [candidate division KSB1 bacterium]